MKVRVKKKLHSPYAKLLDDLKVINQGNVADREAQLIDDSDFKLAPNFITFCLDHLNIQPYPKQIEIGSQLFTDRCPYCTNKDYWDLFDQSLGNILDNTAFLQYGICPKCKRNRQEIIDDSFKAEWQHELVGVAGQRSGKCLTKNTLIVTKRGFLPIGSLSPKNHKMDSWEKIDETLLSHEGEIPVKQLYKTKAIPLRLTTIHGFEIEGRKEHPVRVLTPKLQFVWKTLSNIKKGDHVCIERKQQLWASNIPTFDFKYKGTGKKVLIPKVMSKELARVLGYLVAEGSKTNFYNSDLYVLNDYKRCFDKCFSNWETYERKSTKGLRATVSNIGIYCGSACVLEFLQYLGYKVGSFNQEIPWAILQSPKDMVVEFLKAYFEGDGYSKTNGVNGYSVSKKLVKQIQIVLLNFGIVSFTKKCKYAKNTRPKNGNVYFWTISIRREFCSKFMQEIGFVTNRKNNKPNNSTARHNYYNKVPYITKENNHLKKKYATQPDGYYILKGALLKTKLVLCKDAYGIYDPKSVMRVKGYPYRKLFSKSKYQILRNIALFDRTFSLRVVDILKKYYFFSEVKSVKSLEKAEEVYDFNVPIRHSFIGNGFVNHNSKAAAMIAAYTWHWYTKLSGSPSRYFGLHSTRLHMTFVALSFNQAKNNLWDPFYNYILDSPWFKEYHKFLAIRSKEIGIDPDTVFKVGEQFMVYKHKNIECAPAGPDSRKLRGPTRFFCAIDELGWFLGSKNAIKINPDEVYNPLNNSLTTIRGCVNRLRRIGKFHIPTAYAINISSPSSARDKIMRLLYQSRKVTSMFSFHLPTWEMNPTLEKEDFADEFKKDPIAANRDFGAFPPLSQNPFIGEISAIWDNRSSSPNIFTYSIVLIQTKKGRIYTSAVLNKIRNISAPMLLAIDAGYSGNAFAIVCSSYDTKGNQRVEGLIEVKPVDKNPVNFIHVYNRVLKPILETLNILAVFVDQWQSIDITQKIEEEFEVEAVRYSPKYADFELVRQKLLGEQVILPKPEIDSWEDIKYGVEDYEEFFIKRPVSHLFLQIATVQDSGKRLGKSGDLDDDLFRAMALCTMFTWDEEYKDRLMSVQEEKITQAMLCRIRGLSIGALKSTGRPTLARGSLGVAAGKSRGNTYPHR